ncbi:four helix bundle protein [Aquimarina gracilis]|uniref:Four helix bundle protein n=1 Tax=Aquimarina gracilis TaxID=874422 RepID=A0ABU6A0R6_9FLAO|nr:four helix bundle protein [Aquimarina gracilis]MEB3347755.1 four helix bundle protein [Aquimarina gracilis]
MLYIALGSLSELETQIEISIRLGYITKETDLEKQIVYIRRMILNLLKRL